MALRGAAYIIHQALVSLLEEGESPSFNDLVLKTGYNANTVMRSIRKLESEGYLVVVRRPKRKNIYKVIKNPSF